MHGFPGVQTGDAQQKETKITHQELYQYIIDLWKYWKDDEDEAQRIVNAAESPNEASHCAEPASPDKLKCCAKKKACLDTPSSLLL